MIKNKKGRPQKIKKGRNIIFEVFQSLPQDGSPIRFKDLREKVSMSSATLSKALFYLCSIGQVIKSRVHSQRGKGIEYQKAKYPLAPGILIGHEDIIKNSREWLIKNQNEKPETESIYDDFEFEHASVLCEGIGVIAGAIINALKSYADADKNKKDAVLETHLYLISGLIKEISKNFIDEPFGMSNFTYNMCFRWAGEKLSLTLDDVIIDAAKVMVRRDGMEKEPNISDRLMNKFIVDAINKLTLETYLRGIPANKLKELLLYRRLEIEKIKQQHPTIFDEKHMDDWGDRDDPGHKDNIEWINQQIKYYEQFEPRHKKA
ncbi:Uncharacterised protein [uncultured archaeon]|nr:Uncharacterised protein [uncultured archaeon]